MTEIGRDGQKKLTGSSVAIIGVGALGSCSAELLARAGIGRLILVDDEKVELSNIQRQCLFDEKDIGKLKVSVAEKKLALINSGIEVESYDARLNEGNLDLLDCDLIIDATDNIGSRLLISSYAYAHSIPFIFGSVVQTRGMMFVSHEGPCLGCIIGDAVSESDCTSSGIINTIPPMIASLQVTEAIKMLTGHPASRDLMILDVWKGELSRIKVKKRPGCPVCGADKFGFTVERCKTKAAYSARPLKSQKLDLDSIKKRFKVVMETPMLLVIDEHGEIIVHRHGELMFKALDDVRKIRDISERIYRVGVHGA